jgi:hypothetical protein
MSSKTQERRRDKRYSAVPVKLSLKKDGKFDFIEMKDVSIGGFLSRTNKNFNLYDEFDCKIEIPLSDGKDIIFSRAMVWRIEPDPKHIEEKWKYIAFRFSVIDEYDQVVISEFLSSFDENVPYS